MVQGDGVGRQYDPETIRAIERLSRRVHRYQCSRSEAVDDGEIEWFDEDVARERIGEGFEAGVMWGRWELFQAQVREDADKVTELLIDVAETFEEVDVIEIEA